MQQPAEEQYEEYDSQEGSQYAEEELDVEADLLDAGEEGVEEYESDDGEADGEIAAEGDEGRPQCATEACRLTLCSCTPVASWRLQQSCGSTPIPA